jgi:putative FmdB family regulatory protein
MPTYEYQCTDCGFKFEQFQSIADAPLEECPSCNGKLERLISGGAGLIFKGSGFYITDYKQNNVKQNSDTTPKKKEPEVQKTTEKDKKSSQ